MTARPWWATPEDAGADDTDPVTAHRRARRGGDGDQDEAAAWGGSENAEGHDPDVCGVCPWCAGLRALASSHPEAVAHLSEAARHLSQAVRAVLGDLHRHPESAEAGPSDPVEHIDLD